jgi:AcrR family transcriptional regulator
MTDSLPPDRRPVAGQRDQREQRADAQRNRARRLDVAGAVVAEQGTEASLRDIARRSGIGLGTLYRHFPAREALLEALLSERFDRLAARAASLQDSQAPLDALAEWLHEFTIGATTYRGLAASMVATLSDENSSLYASCHAMREAGGRLLRHAQDAGQIRPDVDGTDLFALASAVGWITDQAPSLAARREHLLSLVVAGLGCQPAS